MKKMGSRGGVGRRDLFVSKHRTQLPPLLLQGDRVVSKVCIINS